MSNFNYTVKLKFTPSKETEAFLIENCIYRLWIYNLAVREIYENHINNFLYKFSKYDLLTKIRHLYEKSDSLRPDDIRPYDYYFRGISECAIDDISVVCSRLNTYNLSNKNKQNLNYRSFNSNRLSFRFSNKIHKEKPKNPDGLYQANRIVLTDDPYLIGIKINRYSGVLALNLDERIDKFHIDYNCIREFEFYKHNEEWFLCLIINDQSKYNLYVKDRLKICGIDLGEINPVVIYDGRKIKIPKKLEYPKNKVDNVTIRINRLHRVLNRKYNHDMDKFHQSNNYYKVLTKLHKAYQKRYNIIKDWHFKLAHWIVTHYRNIVVDEFKDPIIKKDENYTEQKRRGYNISMIVKSICLFKSRLIHMSHKYGTNYFKVIQRKNQFDNKIVFNTTNTCSVCYNRNEIKIDLDTRIFKCEKCGHSIDRDVNAAVNCYNLYKNKKLRKEFLEII